MKYKHIYSETKDLRTDRGTVRDYHAQCVDAYYPDYTADYVPQEAPALIRLAHQVNDNLGNITWQMVAATTEARVIREAIRLFDSNEK